MFHFLPVGYYRGTADDIMFFLISGPYVSSFDLFKLSTFKIISVGVSVGFSIHSLHLLIQTIETVKIRDRQTLLCGARKPQTPQLSLQV